MGATPEFGQLAATIGITADFVNDYSHDALGPIAQITQQGLGSAWGRLLTLDSSVKCQELTPTISEARR